MCAHVLVRARAHECVYFFTEFGVQQGKYIAHTFAETGWEMGLVKAFDKKGPHVGMFSVKYKDDPNFYTYSLLCGDYGKDKNWVLLQLEGRKVSSVLCPKCCSDLFLQVFGSLLVSS